MKSLYDSSLSNKNNYMVKHFHSKSQICIQEVLFNKVGTSTEKK